MFHTNQLQALFDQLEALQQFDLEILPADLKIRGQTPAGSASVQMLGCSPLKD